MFNSNDKKDSLWYTSSFIINSILNFINYSICFKALDYNVFGLYIFLTSLFMVGNTLDFGFGVSTIKHISQAKVRNDFKFIENYFSTFFYLYLLLAFVISSIFLIYYLFFLSASSLINNNVSVDTDFLFLFITIGFFISYITGYLRCVMEGMSEFVNLSKINIVVIVFNTILILILFIFNLNIYYLAIITLSVNLFSLLVTIIFLKLKYKYLTIDTKRIKLKLLKDFYKYGLKIHFSMFIGSFADPIIKYLLGSYISLSSITFFESSKKIINFTSGIIIAAQKSLFVKLSEANEKGILNVFINEKLYFYSKTSTYYSILMYGILNPVLCIFILLWFKSYDSLITFLIFSLSYSFINYASCLYNVLIVEGKGFSLILIQAINIICIYVFLQLSLSIFHNYLGLFGFYLSTLINVFMIFHYIKKDYKFDFKKYLSLTKFYDIIILNAVILFQLILLYYFDHFRYYIFAVTFISMVLIFREYLHFFFSKFKNILRTRFS